MVIAALKFQLYMGNLELKLLADAPALPEVVLYLYGPTSPLPQGALRDEIQQGFPHADRIVRLRASETVQEVCHPLCVRPWTISCRRGQQITLTAGNIPEFYQDHYEDLDPTLQSQLIDPTHLGIIPFDSYRDSSDEEREGASNNEREPEGVLAIVQYSALPNMPPPPNDTYPSRTDLN